MLVVGVYVKETLVFGVVLYGVVAETETVTVVQVPLIMAIPAEQMVQVGGLVAPLAQAEAVNVAEMVWFAVTLENVYVPTAPTDVPSTRTLTTLYPDDGVMVYVLLEA